MKDKENPVEKNPERVAPELETDQFGVEEQKKIVRMVKQDIESDLQSMADWIYQRQKDIQMYEGQAPSLIENLNKEDWMSDRNLGLTAANCDSYQATLLATCYNIDTINFQATEENDIDHKEQLEKFAKWGLGKKEANFFPQADDFIHNKVTQGISYFYIYWDVWYEWVDRRIPKYGIIGKLMPKFSGYDIKTEKKRFERGVIENIADVSDLLFPAHGATLQDKAHLIHRLHKTAADIVDGGKRKLFVNVDEDYIVKLKKHCYDNQLSVLRKEKADALGIILETDLIDSDLRLFPINPYMWYGPYEKNGKKEEYRFIIEPETNKFLAGKPLRKITRSGKRPYVGSPFIRRPGFVRGNSLPNLISDPVNAFNNTWNQKSDFQYVENCPIFFYDPDEGFKKQQQKIVPGQGIPTSSPDSINFPNISRSLAWAMQDFDVLLDIIERLTGAASYFQSRDKQSKTLGQDEMIERNSETRFGLWVNRILDDFSEAITMWIEMYQDWAPPDLGDRVLGEDGKKVFKNLSIETLRGGYDARITPDIISGSKAMKKQVGLWGLELAATSPWFMPQINPKGNWNLTVRAAKGVGYEDIEKFMPPEPKAQFGETKLAKSKWSELKQGDMPEIEQGDDIMELYMGMIELNDTKRSDLDPEYLPNLDVFMFKLQKTMMEEVQRQAMEQQANQMAMGMVKDVEEGRLKKEDVIDA